MGAAKVKSLTISWFRLGKMSYDMFQYAQNLNLTKKGKFKLMQMKMSKSIKMNKFKIL